MTQPTSPTKMKLADLTLDPRLQPRVHGIDETTWREYADDMRRGDILPPIRIIVGRDDQGTVHRWLVEGWHRVEAARSLGWTELPASVSAGTFEQAEDEMLKTNRGHGLRRTQADVQNAIRRALQTKKWQKKADNRIAEHIGCSDKTVTAIRVEMESTSEIPKLARLEGKDGKYRARREPKADAPSKPSPTTMNTIEEVVTKDSSPPMPLELLDAELTESREALRREQARFLRLKAAQPGLSQAERQTIRQEWIILRRIADEVIVATDGTRKAAPDVSRSA